MQSLMVANHVNEELLERCREKVNELNPEFPVGLTLLDDFLVLRALSTRTEKLHRLMVSIWQLIRPEVMGKTAELPRIWAT